MTQGPLVLIVDDEQRNRKLARDVLQVAGFCTLEAATAEEGLALVAEDRPDVILMDIRMPGMSGNDAVAVLKADPGTADIPVVAFTASTMKGDRDRFLAAGFDGYLEKPIAIKEFPEQVRRYCRAPSG